LGRRFQLRILCDHAIGVGIGPSWAQEVRQLPTQTVTLSGTVATIDHNKRIVNIRKADGSFETVDVPAGAQRFDELKAGDKVPITYNNNVSARLKPPGEALSIRRPGPRLRGRGRDLGARRPCRER